MEPGYQTGAYYGDNSQDFTRLMQKISTQIQQIAKNVAQIERSVELFGTRQDSDQMRQKLRDMQQETHNLCQNTMESLKALTSMTPPLGAAASQSRQLKLQKEHMTSEFSKILQRFQAAQQDAVKKEKASMFEAKAAGRRSEASEGAFDSRFPLGVADSEEIHVQMEQTVHLENLKERERALQQIQTNIVDVNEIFKDLLLMIHQQGETVDSIESNIQGSELHAGGAAQHLREAAEYQRKARRKKIICMLILILAVILLVIIIILSTRGSKGSSS